MEYEQRKRAAVSPPPPPLTFMLDWLTSAGVCSFLSMLTISLYVASSSDESSCQRISYIAYRRWIRKTPKHLAPKLSGVEYYASPDLASLQRRRCLSSQCFQMPPLIYCKMAGTEYVVLQSRSTKHKNLLNTCTQHHPRTHVNHIWIIKRVGGGITAAHPFWEWISDFYKYMGDFVCICLDVEACCVTSCFEPETQHV